MRPVIVQHPSVASAPPPSRQNFLREVAIYVGRMNQFTRADWIKYVLWVGLMAGLTVFTATLVIGGTLTGARFPPSAWMVPIGALIFSVSIGVDTIGHFTIYKEEIGRAEGLVHAITIFCGIGSCLLLAVAYSYREELWIPALVLTLLSFAYSFIDEAFHWRRYVRAFADRVEMWSHVGILVGHLTMMIGWWLWFWRGYEGVAQTFAALG